MDSPKKLKGLWARHEMRDRDGNNRRKSRFRNEFKDWCQKKEGNYHYESRHYPRLHTKGVSENRQLRTMINTYQGCHNGTLIIDSTPTERSCDGIRPKEASNDIRSPQCNQLLIRLDLVSIFTTKGLSDRDLFEKGNERNYKGLGYGVFEEGHRGERVVW